MENTSQFGPNPIIFFFFFFFFFLGGLEKNTWGNKISVAVLPRCYAPLGSGFIPSPGAVCAFGPPVFPPASKTGLLE